MATYKIEKGVPLPAPREDSATGFMRRMEIGDSMVLDKPIGIVSRLAYQTAKGTGKKFTCRTVDGGVRVWRVQ